MTIFSLANGRFQGGGILIAPEADIEDGFMHVTLVEAVSLGEAMRNLRILCFGEINSYPKVRHWTARCASITSDSDVPLELDGAPLGAVPLDPEIVPGALRLVAP